jgi:hypothetical protein
LLAKNQRPPLGILVLRVIVHDLRSNRASTGCSSRDPREARPFNAYAISRNSRRKILPTGVIGNDSRNTMCLGTLYAVKFSLQ